jgi:hypothetical protein
VATALQTLAATVIVIPTAACCAAGCAAGRSLAFTLVRRVGHVVQNEQTIVDKRPGQTTRVRRAGRPARRATPEGSHQRQVPTAQPMQSGHCPPAMRSPPCARGACAACGSLSRGSLVRAVSRKLPRTRSNVCTSAALLYSGTEVVSTASLYHTTQCMRHRTTPCLADVSIHTS